MFGVNSCVIVDAVDVFVVKMLLMLSVLLLWMLLMLSTSMMYTRSRRNNHRSRCLHRRHNILVYIAQCRTA